MGSEMLVKLALLALLLSPPAFWLFNRAFPGSLHLTRDQMGKWGVHYERD